MSDLNPCPYCGESMFVNGDTIGSKWSQCNGCESRGPLVRYHSMCNAKTISSAINASNTRAPQSEWVSVETLPERHEWYLISRVDDNGCNQVTMAFLDTCEYINESAVCWLTHNDSALADEWGDVTHWMPLPTPPSEQSK